MRNLVLAGALLAFGAYGFAQAAEGKTASAKGEVLDMMCFMGHGAHGSDHAKCAKGCLLGGGPAGLLKADGSVLLLVEDHMNPEPYKSVAKLAGAQVTVTGDQVSRGGINAIIVQSVKKG